MQNSELTVSIERADVEDPEEAVQLLFKKCPSCTAVLGDCIHRYDQVGADLPDPESTSDVRKVQ